MFSKGVVKGKQTKRHIRNGCVKKWNISIFSLKKFLKSFFTFVAPEKLKIP